jgi:hypothetical protein
MKNHELQTEGSRFPCAIPMTRMLSMEKLGESFHRQSILRGCAVFMFCFCLSGLVFAQRSDSEEGPTASLSFLVLKDDNGKPVRNASVIMHEVNTKGKQGRGDLELKTDLDGKASYDEVPYGTIRVQVLASGFQTYGEDYAVNRPKIDVTIKLKRPQGQFSIYDNNHPSKPQ